MRELKVMLLGSFGVLDGTRSLNAPIFGKAQDLLALMLITPERSVLRESAAEALWPDALVEASKKAMRQALWHIHRAADDGVPDDRRLVLSDGDALRINPTRPLWVDLSVFGDAVRVAQHADAGVLAPADLARLAQAADLYRGPLHAGCYDEWCLIPRARLEDRCLTLLDTLSHEHERRGDLHAAIAWTQRLLDIEPAHERSHRRLMRLYCRTGDRTRALRQLHRCRWILEHELGVRPDARTEALGAAIAADRVTPERAELSAPRGAPPALEGVQSELSALRLALDAIGELLRNPTV